MGFSGQDEAHLDELERWLDPESAVEEAEERQFLDAMEGLEVIPDKDLTASRQTPNDAPRRLKTPKHQFPSPEETLDLHGLTVEEAIRNLRGFVDRCLGSGISTALIITGKGLNSPEGVGVLKRRTEEWILRHGTAGIHAFCEAPRALGGRGAYLLFFRKRPVPGQDR